MGLDFIRKAAPTFKKSWDRHRVSLATPTLLTRQPACVARIAVADLASNVTLAQGETVIVQLNGPNLIAMRGLSEVACFTAPSPDIVSAVQQSCGVARGTVEQIHRIAGVVEISIC